MSNCIPVFSQPFADVVHLVGENDFHCVICVLRIFDQFSLRWCHLVGLFTLENSSFTVLLEYAFCNFSMMCATDENILISKILQMASLDKEFWAVCNLEVWVLFVLSLSRSRNDGALDDRRESIG